MLSNTSVLGAALASWNSTDGIARLKTKKEQPPRPLIKACGLDPVRYQHTLHISNISSSSHFGIVVSDITRISRS